jgi:hypothetical protein
MTAPRTGASVADTENIGTLARTTCGWAKAGLVRDDVRRYWRDVHSPAISRRLGTYTYRHTHYLPVTASAFDDLAGVELVPPADAQLHWQSDMVYRDDDAVAVFFGSPADPRVTALMLNDIEMIVGQSTTYRSVGTNLHTFADVTDDPTPAGPPATPRFHVYFREQPGVSEDDFRAAVTALAQRWSTVDGVLRVRVNLFDKPDMEAERKAGYPVKTHPFELQYQAYMDLLVADESVGAQLLGAADGIDHVSVFSAVHAYPVHAIYTFVYAGTPTIAALRGYPAHELIQSFGATHQTDDLILEWMYGSVVNGLEQTHE